MSNRSRTLNDIPLTFDLEDTFDIPLLGTLSYVSVDDNLRIYYISRGDLDGKSDEGGGFFASFVEMTSDAGGWDHCDSEFSNIGFVSASFDGLRHLNFGEDGTGYVYYPNINRLLALLTALDGLQRHFCREPCF